MIKNFLIASALVIASPALVFSQSFFISFEEDAATSSITGGAGTTGTAYLYADADFEFDASDLNVTSSDSAALLLTGGTATEPAYEGNPFISGPVFNSNTFEVNNDIGRSFAVNVNANGIIPAAKGNNTEFDANAGPNGGILLTTIDYSILSAAEATLSLELGTQGVLAGGTLLEAEALNFPAGAGTVNPGGAPGVPEPSSAVLLVMGAVGMVARRKRA